MPDAVIKVENVSKKFCRSLKKSLWYGMQDLGRELVGRRHGGNGALRDYEFWAVKDVSFELSRGEALGLIGRNGAGKTTLLRLLNGLVKPDTGRVEMQGRVGALIALGAGFNPILSGRENIYINASVLGLTAREIDSRLDAIVDFAELDEFIDAPVQSYSSGMQVRLGFAVAAHLEPDVMLVDEALAVGDARFQKKCFDRIQSMQAKGTAFIIVSHNPYQIESLCQKVAVMHKGSMPGVSEGKQALSLYHDIVQRDLGARDTRASSMREGTGSIRFISLKISSDAMDEPGVFHSMSPLSIEAELEADSPVVGARFRFEISSANNTKVAKVSTRGLTEVREFHGRHKLVFQMTPCQLTSGWYYVDVFATDGGLLRLDAWHQAAEFKIVQRQKESINLSNDDGVFVCRGHWDVS
jgi:lipopolysaccharide transport system ATP-binding protein